MYNFTSITEILFLLVIVQKKKYKKVEQVCHVT